VGGHDARTAAQVTVDGVAGDKLLCMGAREHRFTINRIRNLAAIASGKSCNRALGTLASDPAARDGRAVADIAASTTSTFLPCRDSSSAALSPP